MVKKLYTAAFLSLLALKSVAQTTPDPGLAGSHAVSFASYDLGDLAFTDPSFPNPMEVRGNVHYPSDITTGGGPYPVLILLHGRHETSYQTINPSNTALEWPPSPGYQSITSFQGYDYFAQQMATHGYIVISISANAINAYDNSVSDRGMSARAALTQHHLDLWNTWNTTGGAPFGSLFVGKLDLTNVGTMGHSRGGEGVVAHALLNRSLGNPYGIKAVLPLAPVDFHRDILNGIPMMNIAPYCDGDVSNLQGVHFYDDVRYNDSTDEAPKHSLLVMGANHNFYNTVWTPGSYIAGTSDDWDDNYGSGDIHCGTAGSASGRLTPARQQAMFITYASAFFRYYIGNETAFKPLLDADDIIPPASSTLDSSEVFMSYMPPPSERLDINRELTESAEITNTLGGAVTGVSLVKYDICADDPAESDCSVSSSLDKEPHSGTSSALGMPQLGTRWNAITDYYQNVIPTANQNFTIYQDLQWRASVDFSECTSGQNYNYSIQLIDASGAVSSLPTQNYTNVMYYPPGTDFWELPKVCFNTIKIPLTDFTGIDLTQIQKVKFLYDQETAGSIYITELSLSGLTPLTTSVSHNYPASVAAIYPNPANESFNVKLGSEYKSITSVCLFDIQGKLVYETKNISELMNISMEGIEKGVYILKVTSTKDVKNYKIVKQ
ncbi:MAG: T9SS type A sorting domain-containing protein [Bacteroidia bacterium]